MWKTFEEIKNHGFTTDWKTPLWRIKTEYKVLPSSSQSILSASHLHFSEHTWSPHQAQLGLFLNPHKKKMGLYPNPNRTINWDMNEGMNQPIYCSKKSIKN